MVQCGKCDHWVHARCENMSGKATPAPCHVNLLLPYEHCSLFSDDYYEILSVLPESIVFLCKICASEEDRQKWQLAVREYFEESLAKVCIHLDRCRKHLERYI